MDARSQYEICCGENAYIDKSKKWHFRFIELARLVSTWSKDPSTGCGAVIVDENNRIVSMGFNGLPQRLADTPERLNDRDSKYRLTVHAEINAIMFANRYLDRCTIYVYPMAPCIRCTVQIIQSGICRVISIPLRDNLKERWGKDVEQTKEVLTEAGIKYFEVDYESK